MKIQTQKDLEAVKNRGLESLYPGQARVTVGMSTCGLATGAQDVYNALERVIAEEKLDITLARTGCLGFCQMEPIVDLLIPGLPRLTYREMTPELAVNLVKNSSRKNIIKENLLCKFEEEELILQDKKHKYKISSAARVVKNVPRYREVPYFARQKKIVMRNCGFLDPGSIEEYIARDGYAALAKTLDSFSPEKVITEVTTSGLRGRGGAGFLTGKKWSFCRQAGGDARYIICNADEGDPGAYMDRSVLEGDPHSVLEGMLIGAYAIGAQQGYIYVRSEYPLAITKVENAIRQARACGLLGKNILGSDFSFDLEIRQGAGAFVCGEETSLIASIEGRPPEPRQRPPFPAQSGIWGKPTNINNVETWANIPFIIARGAAAFSQIGAANNSGTKVFSLVGNVNNNGLVEVPMGITLNDIIEEIGGGIPGGKKFKAVQTGGPSGGCIPAKLVSLPVDYESLSNAGSIMGSGGMVVMDEDTCVVDISRFFLTFTREESCGKCSSCRDGSTALLEILTRIAEGKARDDDLDFLEQMAGTVKDASMCGLGQTMPNPVLSTLMHFRDEYVAHIKDKKCPALVCKALIRYQVDPEKCTGCGVCRKACAHAAISGEKKAAHKIDHQACVKCGLCQDTCRFDAIYKT